MIFPFMARLPSSHNSNPAATRSAVVLPQPLGPRIEINSPSFIESENRDNASTVPKRLVTLENSNWLMV